MDPLLTTTTPIFSFTSSTSTLVTNQTLLVTLAPLLTSSSTTPIVSFTSSTSNRMNNQALLSSKPLLEALNSSFVLSPNFQDMKILTQANVQQAMFLLQSSQFDANKCLINCSNHGYCKLSAHTLQYICECEVYFGGSTCQTDSRACSTRPCLNNGTCVSMPNDTASFICECPNNYYGRFCENQLNLCSNKACSPNGYCLINEMTSLAQCKCKTGYFGESCQSRDEVAKMVRACAQIISVLIAIAFLCLVATFTLTMDILTYLGIKPKPLQDKNKSKKF